MRILIGKIFLKLRYLTPEIAYLCQDYIMSRNMVAERFYPPRHGYLAPQELAASRRYEPIPRPFVFLRMGDERMKAQLLEICRLVMGELQIPLRMEPVFPRPMHKLDRLDKRIHQPRRKRVVKTFHACPTMRAFFCDWAIHVKCFFSLVLFPFLSPILLPQYSQIQHR